MGLSLSSHFAELLAPASSSPLSSGLCGVPHRFSILVKGFVLSGSAVSGGAEQRSAVLAGGQGPSAQGHGTAWLSVCTPREGDGDDFDPSCCQEIS